MSTCLHVRHAHRESWSSGQLLQQSCALRTWSSVLAAWPWCRCCRRLRCCCCQLFCCRCCGGWPCCCWPCLPQAAVSYPMLTPPLSLFLIPSFQDVVHGSQPGNVVDQHMSYGSQQTLKRMLLGLRSRKGRKFAFTSECCAVLPGSTMGKDPSCSMLAPMAPTC